MDGHGGGAGKLTRTLSSLLRSPTMRAGLDIASFHALDDPEPDDKKAQAPLGKPRALLRRAHHRFRPGPAQSALLLLPVLTLAALLMRGGDGGHHLALLAAAAGFALAATAAVARLRGARRRSRPPCGGSSAKMMTRSSGTGSGGRGSGSDLQICAEADAPGISAMAHKLYAATVVAARRGDVCR